MLRGERPSAHPGDLLLGEASNVDLKCSGTMKGSVASTSSPHHPQPGKHPPGAPEERKVKERPKGRPISELGWTPEQTREARRQMARWDELWDDPSMDAYDEQP